jgi:hypothetical protein
MHRNGSAESLVSDVGDYQGGGGRVDFLELIIPSNYIFPLNPSLKAPGDPTLGT